MSEANPRQSLVKGERLIRYELASAILVGCRTGPRHLAIQSPRRGRGLRSAPLPNTPQGYPPNGTRPATLFFDPHAANFFLSFTHVRMNVLNWRTVKQNLKTRSVNTSNGTRPAKRTSTRNASEIPPSLQKLLSLFPRRGSRPAQRCQRWARAKRAASKLVIPTSPKKNFSDNETNTWLVYQMSL